MLEDLPVVVLEKDKETSGVKETKFTNSVSN